MKTRMCLALAILIMSVAGKCQERFKLKGRSSSKMPVACFDAGVGYIPDNNYKVFTVTFSGNNLVKNKYGFYALAEVNFKTPTLVIGPTLSVNYYSYIFGGIDFLTSRGIFGQAGLKHARKDLGVGFYPIKWATVKVAYSFHAGPRAEIGIRIPVDKRQ